MGRKKKEEEGFRGRERGRKERGREVGGQGREMKERRRKGGKEEGDIGGR